MKILFLLSILVITSSCSSADAKFCECLKVGEELNDFSISLFERDITTDIKNKMEALKKEKSEKCKTYELMSGKKMLELKETCN